MTIINRVSQRSLGRLSKKFPGNPRVFQSISKSSRRYVNYSSKERTHLGNDTVRHRGTLIWISYPNNSMLLYNTIAFNSYNKSYCAYSVVRSCGKDEYYYVGRVFVLAPYMYLYIFRAMRSSRLSNKDSEHIWCLRTMCQLNKSLVFFFYPCIE